MRSRIRITRNLRLGRYPATVPGIPRYSEAVSTLRGPGSSSRGARLLLAVAASIVVATIGLGSWWGFPSQDDSYLIRLLRNGGAQQIGLMHADRPIYGLLLEGTARLSGEATALYVGIGVLAWVLLAAQAAWLWRLLFPERPRLAPVVGLATISPVVTSIQLTTVTIVFPVMLPVLLVLLALILVLRADLAGPAPRGVVLLAAGLVAAGIAVSEYGLAAAAAALTLTLVLRRWRPAAGLALGVPIGYAVFRFISDVSLRRSTDPGTQLDQLLANPWPRPLRVFSALWYCTIGAWGEAGSQISLDWSSKTTLLAAAAAATVAVAVAHYVGRQGEDGSTGSDRRLAALLAAVGAGLLPGVVIQGWPRGPVLFGSRFELPIVAFASALTVALLVRIVRSKYLAIPLAALAFIATDRLALRAFEERRIQVQMQQLGSTLLPLVQNSPELTVAVLEGWPDLMRFEILVKSTLNWGTAGAAKLWIERPAGVRLLFGPRSGCREPAAVSLEPVLIRWPRRSKVSQILYQCASQEPSVVEPYYLGCPTD